MRILRRILQLMSRSAASRAALGLIALALAAISPIEARATICLQRTYLDPSELLGHPAVHPPYGEVYAFHTTDDGTLLVGTSEGMFRADGDELVAVGAVGGGNAVPRFYTTGDGTLIAVGPMGLYRIDEGRRLSLDLAVLGGVRIIREVADSVLLIGTTHGLFGRRGSFDFRDDVSVAEKMRGIGKFSASPVWAIYVGDHGRTFIGDEDGLSLFDGDDMIPVATDIGEVFAIHMDHDSVLLVGAEAGLFRLEGNDLVRIGAEADIGYVRAIHPIDADTLLVGADRGLYKRDGDDLVPYGGDLGLSFSIEGIQEAGGRTFVFGANGIYELVGANLAEIGSPGGGAILTVGLASDGTVLLGGVDGVYRLRESSWSEAKVSAVDPPSDVNQNVPTVFTWRLDHDCGFQLFAGDIYLESEDIRGSGIKEVQLSPKPTVYELKRGETERTVSATIAFAERRKEPYTVQLYTGEGGSKVPLGTPVTVRVDWTIPDFARFYLPRIGISAAAAHTAIFVLLIFASRWSAFCWRVLTDPVWGKTGLWFYFALRHFGPMQRWVMARWFQSVRRQTTAQPYLPMSLHDDKGARVARTTELLDPKLDWQRLWLQGNAGMGKTAIVLHLQAAFFADPERPTLGKAFARYRSVPVVVPLREYRHVALDRGHPEDWVPSVARMAVSAYGVPFEDHGLFRAMIRSGGFMLVLDGANEVEHDEEIELFARSAPAARVLVTSQMRGSSYFTNWRLPHSITDDIEALLALFLGEERGKAIFARIAPTPLLDAIRSGYDVRLIADVVEDRGADVPLPEGRLGLYELILDAIEMPGGEGYPEDRLCRAAWEMWRDGDRKIEAGRQLDKDLLEPLIREDRKVLRILDGQRFEFRHDQMRAYLAARWAAHHEAHPMSLLAAEPAIWRLSRKEQEEVWDFFAEMFVDEHPDDAAVLWKWATGDPDRVILQHALQGALQRAGRDPQMSRAKTDTIAAEAQA